MRVRATDLSLVPGPSELPDDFSSTELTEIAEYSIHEVASVLDSVARPELPRAADPYQWRWWWAEGSDAVAIGFSTIEGADGTESLWGGSELDVDCSAELLVKLWTRIQERLPSTWLHDGDCRMYRPESFIERWSAD